MKKMRLFLSAASCLLIGNVALAQDQPPANLPSMVIGGIEVRGITTNEEILRSIIYKSLVNSKKYVVNDRYDVAERIGVDKLKTCMGKDCLIKTGRELGADYAMSASYDGLGDRILISMKIVDVQSGEIVQNEIEQFENQVRELNRMTDIMIYRMLKIEVDNTVSRTLIYKDNPAASAGLGKMNNSGPRMGMAIVTEENADFFTRSEKDGGVNAVPVLFNIGYQLEKQYVGGENFSALFEFIGNVAGIEHGTPVPSLAILHGVRFGKGAWEIAMGPSLSMKKLESGTTDFDGSFRTYEDLANSGVANAGEFSYFERPDARGATYFSPNFVVGIGKTFRPGALNVPLNAYASFNKYGTTYGVSLGINITRSRKYNAIR
jgi:hypothetical protein